IDYIQRQNIKRNNIFDTDVLVATKVLENGINLKDENLKRIVIDYVEWDSVIQMIGRVRVKKRETAEPIKVYIIVPSIKMLKSRINKKKKLLEDDSKNLFEKEQAIFDIKSYEALKVMNSNGTRDLSSYIEKIKEFLFLKDSNFDTEKLEQSEYKLYQEMKKRKEEKEELQLIKDNQDTLDIIDRLEFYYSEYGNDDLNFQEFQELAKLLKIPNKSKNGIATSVKNINLVINDFGYKIDQRRFGKKGTVLYTFKTKDTSQHIS
ncbi:MAG: helicase C-terminal domain-containing protein, partial [Anaerococcus vaginalis]|uniref:helicase C-terminal domain-containing protein n=1 Tax=Anaerococcus vaginalis TaxID=33037 RepID=UPI0029097B36|nr:helicase C-terminal domain-containing protein [Anaerococcus vaginalis]